MKKYRIKTEREFIDSFGSDWRRKVRCEFPVEMDDLINHKFSEEENTSMEVALDTGRTMSLSHYSISEDMIIEVNDNLTSLTPTLFRKKRIMLNQRW